MPAASVIHDELIYQINKTKRGALALVAKEPNDRGAESTEIAEGPEPGEEIAENGEPLTPEPPIEEAEPEIGNRTLEGPAGPRLRIGRSRVVSVGSAYHAVTRPNAVALGPLYVSARNAPVLAEAARELADLAHLLGAGGRPGPAPRPVPGTARRLRRHPGPPRPVLPPGVHPGGRRRGPAEMAGIDEDRARLNNAVKGADGFFTTYFVSTYSRFIARWAARRGLHAQPGDAVLDHARRGRGGLLRHRHPGRGGGGRRAHLLRVRLRLRRRPARPVRPQVRRARRVAGRDLRPVQGVRRLRRPGRSARPWPGRATCWTLALAAIGLQSIRHLLDFSFGAANRRAGQGSPAAAHPRPDRQRRHAAARGARPAPQASSSQHGSSGC